MRRRPLVEAFQNAFFHFLVRYIKFFHGIVQVTQHRELDYVGLDGGFFFFCYMLYDLCCKFFFLLRPMYV